MNKTQQKARHYSQVLNQVIERTQAIQEELNPQFEEVKTALANDQLTAMKSSHYLEIEGQFQHGTDEYQQLAAQLQQATPPAKLMGLNFSLVKVYREYVAACQAMIDSMKDDRTVDISAFKAAEAAQDQTTTAMGKILVKMNQIS